MVPRDKFNDAQLADAVQRAVTKSHNDLLLRVETTEGEIVDMKAALKTAFVAGDLEGHRRYHEQMMERTAELRKLRMAIQEKTLTALIYAAILWASKSVWQSAIDGIVAAVKSAKGG